MSLIIFQLLLSSNWSELECFTKSETDPLQFNTVDAFNNYVNHTLVLLVFVGFPGLRGGLGCCPMVLCIQVTHELYLLIVGLFV